MSRCFPFPPPGYAIKERERGLIESIKVQKELKKPNEERKKEKKREKEEKREKSRKKEKSRRHVTNSEEKRHRSKKRRMGELGQVYDNAEKNPEVVEQLAKSGLTEEHGQHVHITTSSGSYNSSDSTLNSGCKRVRLDPSPSYSHDGNAYEGSGLFIRLPFLKQKRMELPNNTSQQQGAPTTSGRMASDQQTDVSSLQRPPQPQPPSTSGRTADLPLSTSAEDQLHIKKATFNNYDNRIGAMGKKFRELIINWSAAPWQTEVYSEMDDGQEWLFQRDLSCKQEAGKRCRESSGQGTLGASPGSSGASYLRQSNIYALPYALPF